MGALVGGREALLQALVYPGYGLELIERVRRLSGGVVRLRPGTLYPALSDLEKCGLVRSRTGPKPGGRGRPRRYYELTPRGISARDLDRRALAGLFGIGGGSGNTSADAVAGRLRRCADVSAAALALRRSLLSATRQR